MLLDNESLDFAQYTEYPAARPGLVGEESDIGRVMRRDQHIEDPQQLAAVPLTQNSDELLADLRGSGQDVRQQASAVCAEPQHVAAPVTDVPQLDDQTPGYETRDDLRSGRAVHANNVAKGPLINIRALLKDIEDSELRRCQLVGHELSPQHLVRLLQTADQMPGVIAQLQRLPIRLGRPVTISSTGLHTDDSSRASRCGDGRACTT